MKWSYKLILNVVLRVHKSAGTLASIGCHFSATPN